jgi:hypothetical protein
MIYYGNITTKGIKTSMGRRRDVCMPRKDG